jgi:hypothetical protein
MRYHKGEPAIVKLDGRRKLCAISATHTNRRRKSPARYRQTQRKLQSGDLSWLKYT